MLTLVTAWYRVKNKFHNNEYTLWMDNLLNENINCNIIIFTNIASVTEVIKYASEKIKIILKEFEEFHCYSDKWISNHIKNLTLNQITCWELNMIWNEKVSHVNDALCSKLFESEYYCYCDIGYFRNKEFNIVSWPCIEILKTINNDKIYYGQVCHDNVIKHMCELYQSKLNLISQEIDPKQISVAGGFFLLNKSKIKWWFDKYYCILDAYWKNNYLVKDDQMIIFTAFLNNIEHFQLVKSTQINPWFVFQYFLK